MKRQKMKQRQEATDKRQLIKIAIFASGAGSNAQKITRHYENNSTVKIALIVCNNPKAGVLTMALKENIPVLIVEKNKFMESGYVEELKDYGIQLIVLAGFLW